MTETVADVPGAGAQRLARRALVAVAAALRPFRWPAAFIALYLCVDLVCIRAVGISVSGLPVIAAYVGFVFAGGILWSAAARLFREGSAAALVLGRLGEGASFFAIGGAGAALTAIFVYPCNRLGLPLRDAAFARIDAALGFHWPDWMAFLARHPALNQVLRTAYHSHILQYLLLYFVVAALPDRKRAAEFFWAVNLSGVVTCLASGLLPALGAITYFQHASAPWLHDLLLVREPVPARFALTHLVGIVTLPSYHTALAVMFIWAVRRTGIFGWAIAALDIAMIVSTPAEGGHYLIDVITGCGLAAAVIWAVNRALYGRQREALGGAPVTA